MSATSSISSAPVSSNSSTTQVFTLHLKSDQRINFITFSDLLRLGDPGQVTHREITALRELSEDGSTLPLRILEKKCFAGWTLATCLHSERNDRSIRCTMTFTGVELPAYTAQIPLISEIARASICKPEPMSILALRLRRHKHRGHRTKSRENPFFSMVEQASSHSRRRNHRSRSRPSLSEK